jgi:hypothetical protein
MTFVGPGGTGVSSGKWIGFHWALAAGNSLGATALFGVAGSEQVLATLAYGGGTAQGTTQAFVPQGETFAFGLDSQIYKGAAAALTITDFTDMSAVPEASTWYVGLALAFGVAWNGWRRSRACG